MIVEEATVIRTVRWRIYTDEGSFTRYHADSWYEEFSGSSEEITDDALIQKLEEAFQNWKRAKANS